LPNQKGYYSKFKYAISNASWDAITKSYRNPDDVRKFTNAKIELANLGDSIIGR